MTEPRPITSVKDYKTLLDKEFELPSGAIFRIKRRLDFQDYMELLNVFSKELGEPISSDIFTKVQRNPEMIIKMIQFTVPRMCIDPKVSVVEIPDAIPIHSMAIDDLIFINNMSMKIEMSEEVRKIVESFRNKQSTD